MTTTFEEAWFVNYLSNQTCTNLIEICLGWISSFKTSLNPLKKFRKSMLRMSNFREFPRKMTWGTFCRYLARDKISTFHILTCLPFCNLINLILNLYLRFFFLFELAFLFLFLCICNGIWSTIHIRYLPSTYWPASHFATSSISLYE